tara:strand:- start:314 stop:643 length:330 start_codon:yes stop_codon:yes gene_type:complete
MADFETRKANKKYINGIMIKEHVFENGGKILKMSIKKDEFIACLEECDVDLDFPQWINVIMARRKTPSEKGVTHYMYEDEWKPDKTFNETNDPQYDKPKPKEDESDLPF